jgi:hypothetical protein
VIIKLFILDADLYVCLLVGLFYSLSFLFRLLILPIQFLTIMSPSSMVFIRKVKSCCLTVFLKISSNLLGIVILELLLFLALRFLVLVLKFL